MILVSKYQDNHIAKPEVCFANEKSLSANAAIGTIAIIYLPLLTNAKIATVGQ